MDPRLSYLLITSLFCYSHSNAGFLNIEELEDLKYMIDILPRPLNAAEVNISEGIQLSSKHGQDYFCKLPGKALKMADQADMETRMSADYSIPKLLDPLKSESCMTIAKGWWTYKMCYMKNIQQYHAEDGKIASEIIILGQYEKEFDWNDDNQIKAKLFKRSRVQRYHTQYYTNGTICDVINHGRDTEVRYFCDEAATEAYIERIDEPSTCSYIITIRTHLLCPHPHTKLISNSKSIDIICQPVLSSRNYGEFVDQQTKTVTEVYDKANTLLQKKRDELKQLFSDLKMQLTPALSSSPLLSGIMKTRDLYDSGKDGSSEKVDHLDDDLQQSVTKEQAIGFIQHFVTEEQILKLSKESRKGLMRTVTETLLKFQSLPTADLARIVHLEVISFFERQELSSHDHFLSLIQGRGISPAQIGNFFGSKVKTKSSGELNVKLRHYQADGETKIEGDDKILQELEEEIAKELASVGFSFPSRIEIRLVTNQEPGQMRELSSGEAKKFKEMLLEVMGGTSNENKAKEKYNSMSEGYNLVYVESESDFSSRKDKENNHPVDS